MEKDRGSRRAKILAQYRSVFGSADGKAVLVDMMKANYFLRGTCHENPQITAHREGSREVILSILRILKTDPEQVMKNIEQQEENW